MIHFPYKDFYGWEDFLEIVRLLRSENGCPWDRVQTHESIRRNFLEETYEALDALDRDNADDMREELGDVVLQCAFHAQIERERGRFAMPDVIDAVTRKLLYRHPHVFGDVFGNAPGNTPEEIPAARNGRQALETWEARKRQEKGHVSVSDAVESVPHTLPALWRAEKIQKKVAKAGFDWDHFTGALDKLEEEIRELREAVENLRNARNQTNADDSDTDYIDNINDNDMINAPHGIRDEVGDVLFMAAKIALDYHIDPEDALHRTCDKFERRFRLVEEAADKPLSDCTQSELLMLWKNAKKHEKHEV